MAGTKPLVSLVLAVRNEVDYIDRTLRSLTEQETPNIELEILVIDGASSDGTQERIETAAVHDSRIRLLKNPLEKTPFAFNLGIAEARGEYVCVLGAHSEYERNYITTCLAELKRSGAVGCSGRIITAPSGSEWQARLAASTLAHPFGTSRNSTHNQGAGYRETVPYPLFVREALLEAGGYDERLFRNQDNDMNCRLRALGYKLYLSDKTHALYFQKPTLVQLFRRAFTSGFWNVICLRKNPRSMSLRHFIPALFVFSILVSVAIAITLDLQVPEPHYGVELLLACIGVHLSLGFCFATLEWLGTRDPVSFALPVTWLSLHLCYGFGSLWAIISNAKLPAEEAQARAVDVGMS